MICPFFYFYHDELICKCTQEKIDCCAILEKCKNKQGRLCYLFDKEEENDQSN